MTHTEFKAKVNVDNEDEVRKENWFKDLVDNDDYVTGYFVDGYIVGDVLEADSDYMNIEWWIPVDESTLEIA